jgi:His-Xaa-Ser system radical SAM maturase HxsC
LSLPLQTFGVDRPRLKQTVLGRVTSERQEPSVRSEYILMTSSLRDIRDLAGYAGILTLDSPDQDLLDSLTVPVFHSVQTFDHLEPGDVVALNPGGYIRTLYRIFSPHNAIFTTDRCNSYCLMCSQPPKSVDDGDRIAEHLRLIELMSPAIREIGITGGEPTLLKDDLLRIIERCKERLPETALHILSNGRLFYYGSFARRLAAIGHPNLMIGVPLYSDLDEEHDFVVQCRGAFDQTLVGLCNLARFGVPVEIRVVIHRHTYARLPELAEFIYRNLPFASHVALMGLELMGFAVPNARDLWIDPHDYQEELRRATTFLARRGMNVSIYNHQLCVVPRELWRFCAKSISDWKNDYLPECDICAVRDLCGGFFSSSLKRLRSQHIRPLEGSFGTPVAPKLDNAPFAKSA